MPIVNRKPEDCFREFHEHVRRVFELTLPPPAPVRITWMRVYGANRAVIEFTRGDGVGTCLPVDSEYGPLYLSLYQALTVVPEGKRWRLETLEYGYRLIDRDEPRADAAIRWEYVRDPLRPYPRHHIQTRSRVELADGLLVLPLDRLHTPTGWVTFEGVIRFLISELGVKPRDDNWPAVLSGGERKFFEEFTSKRHWPLSLLPGGKGS